MDIFSDYEKYISVYRETHIDNVYKLGRFRDKNQTVINFVPCGFDIETTTQYTKDSEHKVISHYTNMYIWQFSFDEYVFFGRTWSDFNKLLQAIENVYCTSDVKFLFFIHNMAFESAFMIKELKAMGREISVFARKKRHPLKLEIDNKIIILDSMLLTGYSLEKLAKNYTKTQKLKGDLDYSIPRNYLTPITNENTNINGISKQELAYCRNDVIILKEFAQVYEERYLKNNYLPLTSTMIASRVVKEKIKETESNKEKYFLISNAYPKNRQQYDYIMQYYTGAYTHGMLSNLFVTHKNVLAYDVTSEYPYVLMAKEYPVGKVHQIPRSLCNEKGLEKLREKNCVLLEVEFENIRTKTGVTILSKNKIVTEEAIYDNGRLYEAKKCFAFLTEIDIDTLALHYEWDRITFKNGIYAKKGYLPSYFRLAIAELYAKKCTLKGVEGMEVEYMRSKADLNGQYGALCTRISNTEIALDDDGNWIEEPHENDFEKLAKTKNTLPIWAVYCTAYARNLILSTIAKLDMKGYYYSDTDSIKCSATKKHIKMFDEVNKEIRKNNQEWITDLNLLELYPSVDFSEMGTFTNETTDKEGNIKPLKRFKTLGSKRYIVEEYDGKIIETVAGLPKGTFKEYCDKRNLDYFETFSKDGISMTEEDTHKLASYYKDDITQIEVTDYLGNVSRETLESYVSLIPTTFNLSITRELQLIYDRVSDIKGIYR